MTTLRLLTLLLIVALLLPAHLHAQEERDAAPTPIPGLPTATDGDDPEIDPVEVDGAAVLAGTGAMEFPPLGDFLATAEPFTIDEVAAEYPQAGQGIPFDGPLPLNGGALGAHSVYAADLDRDGDLDVVSAARDDGGVVWYRNMGGINPAFEPYLIGTVPGVYLALPADVNGDGKIDIITVSVGTVSSDRPSGQPGQGRVLWFQNNGAAFPGFEVRGVAEGLNYPVSAQVGDLDGDGALDIVVATRDDNAVRWFRNSGGVIPSFAPILIAGDVLGAVSVDVGDINRDGALDVVSASENDDRIVWFANNGSGGFSANVVRPGAPDPEFDFAKSVHLADLNDDGLLDIAYVSEDQNQVGWYRNGGGAVPGWTQQVLDNARVHVKQVTSGDIDGDGDLDLIAASADDNVVALYRNGGGASPTFTTHIVTVNAPGARWVHVADLDGNGAPDLLVAARTANLVAWFPNRTIRRSAVYSAQGHHALGIWQNARFVTSGDLDGDGDMDLVSVAEDDLVWHQNRGGSPPTFGSLPIVTNMDRARWIDIADLDGDGDNDLIVASTESRQLFWYESSGGAQPVFTERLLAGGLEGPRAAVAGDLDRDGDLDVFAVSDTDHKVMWYENNGARPPVFTPRQIDNNAGDAVAYPRHIQGADIDNDGDLDLIVAAQSSSTIAVYFNNGNRPATFSRRIVAAHNPSGEPKIQGVQHVWASDVNGDGAMDILAASEVSSSVYWFENADGVGGSFIPHAVDMDAAGVHAVVGGDADNDGDIDLFAALEYTGLITWYENNGQPTPGFTRRTIYDQAPIAHSVNVVDVDGDGDLDALATARGTGIVAWFENLGGQFAFQDLGATIQPGTPGPRSIQSALLYHRGRAGDPVAHLGNVLVRFLNAAGNPLSTQEVMARVTSLALYVDSNPNGAWDGSDRLVVRETRIDQAQDGRISLAANLGEAAAIGAGGAVRVFVVAQLSPACDVNASLRPAIIPTSSTVVNGLSAGALLGEGMRSLGSATVSTVDAAAFLRINEVVMLNQTGITDPQEPTEYPDWIEIYNTGPYTVDMSGMFLTDSAGDLTRSRIGAGVRIGPYGRLLFIADGEPTQGPLHTTFRLDNSGERLLLVDTTARLNRVLDDVTVPALLADQAYARRVDGSTTWWKTMDPTPNRANALAGAQPVQWLPLISKSMGC